MDSAGEPREVFVALGSNRGDRRAHLEGAVQDLRAVEGVEVVAVSPFVETAPVGGPPGQGPFLNGVLRARTTLGPHDLLARLQEIEERHGRDRSREERHGPRTLDLDLLTYGDLALDDHDLVLPHPRMEERTFVLEPLAALAPDLRLARSGRTVRERLRELGPHG